MHEHTFYLLVARKAYLNWLSRLSFTLLGDYGNCKARSRVQRMFDVMTRRYAHARFLFRYDRTRDQNLAAVRQCCVSQDY